jgi:hypothetical protein
MSYTFLARLIKSEPIPGIKLVSLQLLRDADAVELVDNDEFVTVNMVVNPFEDKP